MEITLEPNALIQGTSARILPIEADDIRLPHHFNRPLVIPRVSRGTPQCLRSHPAIHCMLRMVR